MDCLAWTMESVLLNDGVLTRVFRHLTVQELVQSALLVCHKWKDVALFELHRNIPLPLFQLLKDGCSATNSPLRRYHSIFERNLLRDTSYEALRLERRYEWNPPTDWWVTKDAPRGMVTQSRQLCTRASSGRPRDMPSALCRYMGR